MLTADDILIKLSKLKIEKRAFISGQFVDSVAGLTIDRVSSADGRPLLGLTDCNAQDVNLAVEAAHSAFLSRVWVDKSLSERKLVLLKLASLMSECKEELALLDTVETGRSFKNYIDDSIPKAIEVILWFAESADKQTDNAIPLRRDAFATVTRVPLGVVGCITPWNDPLVPAMWKMVPALLMGNSVVMKPAEQSSYSLLKVASLAKKAGIPDGVLNIIPGRGEIAGKTLAMHPLVRGIFFTGSSEVAALILQYSGLSNLKKVGLECGGKSAFIVSNKCNNLQEAAAVLAKNIFYNQGQICSAPSRAFVHDSIFDTFLCHLKEESLKYIPDDSFDPRSNVGCLIDQKHKEKVEAYIEEAQKLGLDVFKASAINKHPRTSCFINPTIILNPPENSKFYREEIFGPVLCLSKFLNIKQAVKMANDSDYGLAAAIWTNDLDESFQVSRLLEAGIVHVNSYGEDDMSVPFGGVKKSGIGREKSHNAFSEYSEVKTIWLKFKELE